MPVLCSLFCRGRKRDADGNFNLHMFKLVQDGLSLLRRKFKAILDGKQSPTPLWLQPQNHRKDMLQGSSTQNSQRNPPSRHVQLAQTTSPKAPIRKATRKPQRECKSQHREKQRVNKLLERPSSADKNFDRHALRTVHACLEEKRPKASVRWTLPPNHTCRWIDDRLDNES